MRTPPASIRPAATRIRAGMVGIVSNANATRTNHDMLTLLFIGVVPENYALEAHTLASFVGFFTVIAAQLLTWRALRIIDDVALVRYRTYSLSGALSLALLVVFVVTSNKPFHG